MWFLDTSIHLIQSNHKLGYSIAPSFAGDNLAVWLLNGSCALKSARWYYLVEKVDGKVITRNDSYLALVHFFVGLLKQVEGPGVMHRLSRMDKDMFSKMSLSISDRTRRKWHDLLIRNHPALMSTAGCFYILREADMLLKHVLLNGSATERAIAKDILSHVPYLWPVGPASEPSPEEAATKWVSIALGHEALRYWYEHQRNQRAEGQTSQLSQLDE